MSALAGLLDKARAADGPNREIDGDIFAMLGGDDWQRMRMKVGEPCGAPEDVLDREARFYAPHYTASIDAAVAFKERLLPGWWWTCGDCALTHDASIAVPGSSGIGVGHALAASLGPDFRASAAMRQLLAERPELDAGFHVDRRTGTVALSLIEATLEAYSALIATAPDAKEGPEQG